MKQKTVEKMSKNELSEIFGIKKDNGLLKRIKKGKRWLINNRLEYLQSKGDGKKYDFKKWYKNWVLYLDLYEKAYNLGIVDCRSYDLFHPWAISDLMPMLKKVFEKKRFDDALI